MLCTAFVPAKIQYNESQEQFNPPVSFVKNDGNIMQGF